jgi:hypothetical protein
MFKINRMNTEQILFMFLIRVYPLHPYHKR